MKQISNQFLDLYQRIVDAKTLEEIKNLCCKLIGVIRTFFIDRMLQVNSESKQYNFEDLAAWYEEGRYTFRRIDYYCQQKDVFNAFVWGYNFQQEFDYIREEFGLEVMDIMSIFDSENLEAFQKRAEEYCLAAETIRKIIYK